MSKRRVAVLGGTLDPVHLAHVSVLEQVVKLLAADQGRLVPSFAPPHRVPAEAPAASRLAMAQAAVAGRSDLTVDDLEIRRGGISYTIDTLAAWHDVEPDAEIHLILGADVARLMPQWHRADELLSLANFVLINRSGVERVDVAEAAALGFSPERTRLLQVVSPSINASEVRRRIRAGEPVAAMVDAAVLAIIERDHLYADAAN